MQTITHNNKELLFENNNSDKLIIFSHGFGVRWDFKGFFTQIAESLKGFDFIYFDYTNVGENGDTYVESVPEQTAVLKNVLDYVETKTYKEINIITHSFGAICPLIINPNFINKLILLAPPTIFNKERYERRFKEKGMKWLDNGYAEQKRSDGTTTFVNKAFYESVYDINFFEMINKNLSKEKYIIMAIEDEIVENYYPENSLNSEIKKIDIHGDHNFKGDFRIELINQIKNILN